MSKALYVFFHVCAAIMFAAFTGVAIYASICGARRVPADRREAQTNLYRCGDMLRACEVSAKPDCMTKFDLCRGTYATSLAELNLIRGCAAGGR